MTYFPDRSRSPGALFGVSLAAVAAMTSLVSPASAQTAAADDVALAANGTSQGDIVVTAQFRSQRLQDTPIAITALNAEALAARGNVRLTDLRAPNLSIQQSTGGYGPSAQIYMRGIGQYDSNFTFEPGVGIYIDDVYYSTVFGNVFDLLDLDRVEILRGPQGTLAGKNTIGGALKLYSKKPDGSGANYVEAQVGSYNLVNMRAAADITFAPDMLYARISGMARHTRGYVDRVDYKCANPGSALPSYANNADSCLLGREGGSNDVGVRGQLRFLPADKLEINVSGDYYTTRGDPNADVLIATRVLPTPAINGVGYGPAFISPDNYTTYATFRGLATSSFTGEPKVDLNSWGVSGSLDYTLTDSVKFTSITAYRAADAVFGYDYDDSPIPRSESVNYPKQHQFTQEARLNFDLGKIADLTTGVFYYKGRSTQAMRSLIASINSDFFGADAIRSRSKSAFVHGVFHVTDRLNLTGGLRYTDDYKKFTFARRTVDGSFSASQTPLDGLSGTFKKNVWDYRAVVDYRWSPSFFTYAQFSTGFKGGGVNPRPFSQNQVVPFGPERLKSYEIGFKSDFFDRRARLNVSAFYNDYTNMQLQASAPFFNVNLPIQNNAALPLFNPTTGTSPAGVFINAGDAHQKGVEAELTLTPAQGLQIDGSMSYLAAHYTRLLPQATISGLNINMDLPFSPKWTGNAGIQYEAAFAGGTLTPRVDYQYKGTSFSNPVNDPRNRLEARNVLNARLTYKTGDGNWEGTLAVTNLTNDFFFYSKADLFVSSGYVTGVPTRPREWSFSLRRKF
jgi:iron complex outermembrane receptor protein